MKAIAILWIAFFHSFETWQAGRYPNPLAADYFPRFLEACGPSGPVATAGCALLSIFVGITRVGFHAVAVFLVLSGFGLAYSLAKTGDPEGGWPGWFRSRLFRLFPMYWIAHLVYLVSPFQARPEAIDWRFLLSFLGDRIWPVYTLFYYFNPALWYFGLILELYLVFPLLFRLLQRLGTPAFLAVSAFATLGGRYVMLYVWPVHGYWLQGAFFLPRLWEFALGMALGFGFRRDAAAMERALFHPATLAAGLVVYLCGVRSYVVPYGYVFTDALVGSGLFVLVAHAARGLARVPGLGPTLLQVGVFSYGLYLLHQPYVIYAASKASALAMPAFVILAAAVIATIAIVAMTIERRTNELVNRLVR